MSRRSQFIVESSSESEEPNLSGDEREPVFRRVAVSDSHAAKGKRPAVSSSQERSSKLRSAKTALRPPLSAVTNTAGSAAAPGPWSGLRRRTVKEADSDDHSSSESERDGPSTRSKAKRQKRGVEQSTGS